MTYQCGINSSSIKFKQQIVNNLTSTVTNIDVVNGNYISCNLNTSFYTGYLRLLNSSNNKIGSVCLIHYNQLTSLSLYKVLYIYANVKSGFNSYNRQDNHICLYPGESVLLMQETTINWRVIEFNNTNLRLQKVVIPFNETWNHTGIAGTTVTSIYEDMVGISKVNCNIETTGNILEIRYPFFFSSNIAYKIYITGQLGTNKGRIIAKVNYTTVNQNTGWGDFYHASSTNWVTKELKTEAVGGLLTLDYTGERIIIIGVSGKNAASSAYNTKLSHLTIYPQVNPYI
jgi:hypothetical protein